MTSAADPHRVSSLEALEALYGAANPNSLAKEVDHLNAAYRAWIERAPFFAVATIGTDGLDCSPRGDRLGDALAVLDDRVIAFADRRGNNRLDTLRNLIEDPRIALLFLIPGINETLRVNGTAEITTDPTLMDRFDMGGKKPLTVIRVHIGSVYFQCARALVRAGLWTPETFAEKGEVPTAGQMTKAALPNFDAEAYDDALPGRQAATLY